MLNDMTDMVKMLMLTNLRGGSDLFYTVGLMFLLSVFTALFDQGVNWTVYYEWVQGWFRAKHVVILEGQRCTTTSFGTAIVSSTFTDRFKAVWSDIIQNIATNTSVREVRELTSDMDRHADSDNMHDLPQQTLEPQDLFIVSQKHKFLYHHELQIYAKAELFFDNDPTRRAERTHSSNSGGNNEPALKYDKIVLKLFSYVTPVNVIIKHVDAITEQYLNRIQRSRKGKQFIYTLSKVKHAEHDEHPLDCWKEYPFASTRTFANLFFKDKEEVLAKINFFLQNPAWYAQMGIQYAFGIGLHGPPGTGKTSFIKSLANMTKRHLIVLSLKMIKTRTQLLQFFYEERYNLHNLPHSIDFSNKIVVIEDIDCAGDLVCKRELMPTAPPPPPDSGIQDALNVLMEEGRRGPSKRNLTAATTEDPLTLDDLLNVLDGLQETPGRLLIISSNHYNKLDPALVRPGRIDLTLELTKTNVATLAQIYRQCYSADLPEAAQARLIDAQYTPAEVMNMYMEHRTNPQGFVARLLE